VLRSTRRATVAVLTAGAAMLALVSGPAASAQTAADTAQAAARHAATGRPAAAAAPSTVNYVALGDSYSSGVGSGSYTAASGSCDQSPGAYPALWAVASDPATYSFQACSGATVGNVITSQLPALSSSTTLVSITVGGDDIGFTSVMESCALLFFITEPCTQAVDAAENVINTDLPGDLDTLFADIKADAPNANVVVLGYPDFFDTSVAGCPVMLPASRAAVNQASDMIDSVIQAAAVKYGDTYADVRPAFAGHEVCDSDPWINKLDWTDVNISYHPTAEGQSEGYLPVFSAAATAAAAKAKAQTKKR
jgi:hypothetical protein